MNSSWRSALPILRQFTKQEIRLIPIRYIVNNLSVKKHLTAVSPVNVSYNVFRNKSKKQTNVDSDDEQEVFDEDDVSLSRDSKLVKFKTTSLRTDVVIKSALGVSRNKVEQVFYESKIRVNGKKIMKKSHMVKVGSEIDVIKSVSPHNPDHLYVARIEVLNIVPKEEDIAITVRRFKNLLIENYEDDPYKSSGVNDS
ncbi:PREDICTED: uncharacterized protein C6orf203 homolog [Papilio polytes]|uniref:uncharacterized protein C6orf203 homolog n=1 Tax=Papilio polytes TaxID=76194 RepID=UPI00067622B6|nr:PREDICTED: uncharacterized protein C6orf203 homolog [Papilio polytes]